MKYLREFSIPLFLLAMGLSIAWVPALQAQLSSSNQFSLNMILSNNLAVLTIQGEATNSVGPVDLFFKTNFTDSQGWTWLIRCPASQTNVVMSNLPPAQGFFMVGVTNAIRPGFDAAALPREDDSPSTNAPLLFSINYFNAIYSNVWINNNGNVSFDSSQWAYTPTPLNSLGVRIIAPYWADVDTQNPNSDVVKFGANTVDGHAAFGVDWVNVGYYQAHADNLLSCQLVIIDRSDVGPGDFDLEFNYFKVEWEWGDVSVGKSARAGYSDGVTDYELSGSGVEGAFLDSNPATGLIYHNLNSSVPGRYVFSFRNGEPQP